MPDPASLIAEADALDVDAFIRVNNARANGHASDADVATPIEEAPSSTAAAGADATTDVSPDLPAPKVDRRTREGRKLTVQQEIDALIATKHDTERQHAADEAAATTRLANIRADITAEETRRANLDKPPVEPPKPGTTEWARYKAMPEAPQLKDFEDFADWNIAMNLFIADARFDERMQAHEAKQTETQRGTAWQTKLAAARVKDPDLDTKLDPKTPATAQMRDFIMESDRGVELLAHLSAHQDLARRLVTLHPLKVAEEMTKLAMRLDAAHSGPAQPPVISAAKPLIKPVSSSHPIGDDDADEADLPVEDFIRRGNQRDPSVNLRAARH